MQEKHSVMQEHNFATRWKPPPSHENREHLHWPTYLLCCCLCLWLCFILGSDDLLSHSTDVQIRHACVRENQCLPFPAYLRTRRHSSAGFLCSQSSTKKTSNSLLHQLMRPSNHLTSLKVYHQYVETEEMSLFCFHRAVKFWIRVESLDNQASV